MSKLIHFNTLDLNLVNIFTAINNDNNVTCGLSYNNSEPLMFFIDSLNVIKFTSNVIKFTSNEIILDLRNNEHIKKLFDDFDTKIISDLQAKKVTKLYGLKKFSYVPFVSNYTNSNGEIFDVLKLRINLDGDYKTSMFFKYGQPVLDLNILNEKVTVKTIVECIQVVFDKENKTIYVDNCVRQLKVKQMKLNRVKNLEYSFIDSDDEISVGKLYQEKFKSNLDMIYEGVQHDEENNKTEGDKSTEEDEKEKLIEEKDKSIGEKEDNEDKEDKLIGEKEEEDKSTEEEEEEDKSTEEEEEEDDKSTEEDDDDETYTASIIKELQQLNGVDEDTLSLTSDESTQEEF